jgi:hypothetical protein
MSPDRRGEDSRQEPSNRLLPALPGRVDSSKNSDECLWRARPKGDVHEHLSKGLQVAQRRVAARHSELVNMHPNLLVTRAWKSEEVGHLTQSAVRLRDGKRRIIECRQSRQELRVNPWCRRPHRASVAAWNPRVCVSSVRKETQVTVCYLLAAKTGAMGDDSVSFRGFGELVTDCYLTPGARRLRTSSVACIPRLRWSAIEHQSVNLPGKSSTSRSRSSPGAVSRMT